MGKDWRAQSDKLCGKLICTLLCEKVVFVNSTNECCHFLHSLNYSIENLHFTVESLRILRTPLLYFAMTSIRVPFDHYAAVRNFSKFRSIYLNSAHSDHKHTYRVHYSSETNERARFSMNQSGIIINRVSLSMSHVVNRNELQILKFYTNRLSLYLEHEHGDKMNNYNDSTTTRRFQFSHAIPSFSINQVDQYEDPEEKMHCFVSMQTQKSSKYEQFKQIAPRTPYGFMKEIAPKQQEFRYDATMDPLVRTHSASSFESINSVTLTLETDENNLNFTPTLSATPSVKQLGNLEQMYSINTPEPSPPNTPKAIKEFGTERDRNQSLEAIHAALSDIQTKRSKSFNAYKHGAGTYSNGHNSGCNTTGTATPNSCGSFLEVIEGSEYSFEADMNDLESERSDKEETPVPSQQQKQRQQRAQMDGASLPIFDRNGYFGLAQISEDVETQSIEEKGL